MTRVSVALKLISLPSVVDDARGGRCLVCKVGRNLLKKFGAANGLNNTVLN